LCRRRDGGTSGIPDSVCKRDENGQDHGDAEYPKEELSQ